MCDPIAATSSVSSVTLSMGKVSYRLNSRASANFKQRVHLLPAV